MIPVTKIPKQSVSSALLEKKKRQREREKAAASKKYPPDAKARFGRTFQTKLSTLLLSDDAASEQQLKAMYDEVLNYYNEHDLTEMWLSDDNDDNEVKPPVAKKMHMDAKVGLPRPKPSIDEKEKMKPKSFSLPSTSTSAPSTAFSISNLELSDDSEEEPTGKAIASAHKTTKQCNVCGEGSNADASTNLLLDCDECGKSYHLRCNKSEVSLQQAQDPRFLFVCSNCKDRESKVDRGINDGNGSGKTSIGKKDEKTITQKPDISAAFATFAAKKKKIGVPAYGSLPSVGGLSRPGNGLPNAPTKPFPSFMKK